MKLYCLSDHPIKPCFVMSFKHVTIMLDCALDLTPALHFLPLTSGLPGKRQEKTTSWSSGDPLTRAKLSEEVKEYEGQVYIDGSLEFCAPIENMFDMTQVDVILVSNCHNMLALPYITEYTEFSGKVYATEPTMQIGHDLMVEIVEYVGRLPKKLATLWKDSSILKGLPKPLCDVVKPASWRQIYTKKDVEKCTAQVQLVGFNNKLDVFGIQITPVSAGLSIGSCNWLIETEFEKISYVSGSSTLTTHPQPMDHSSLNGCDLMILTSLTQTPNLNPDSMIGEFCMLVALTLKLGGNVLVPCYPSGVTYDLFECLSAHLECCGLAGVPMFMIDPVSDSSLAYSNIYAEWLSSSKQSKVYLPEPPFPHAELVKNGRLKHYKTIHGEFSEDYRTPCVMFTGHPSLRFGDVIHFLDMWGHVSQNTIIFTVADFNYVDALAPFQPLAMKVSHCPIDTSLNFTQANKLVRDLRPTHLAVPQAYTPTQTTSPDQAIVSSNKVMTFRGGDVLSVPIHRKFERIYIESKMAAGIVPREIRPGTAIAMVSGNLRAHDNRYYLESPAEGASVTQAKKHVCGPVNVTQFVDNLRKAGVTDLKVEDMEHGCIVHLQSDDTLIQIEKDSTHIICDGNETLRIKIRDALLQCMSVF